MRWKYKIYFWMLLSLRTTECIDIQKFHIIVNHIDIEDILKHLIQYS